MMFSGRLGCSLHGFLPISEPPFAIKLEFLVKITQSWFFCFCALASTAAWADDAAQPALLTASAPATPSVIEDEIQQTWQQRDFQLSDDIVVVDPPPAAPQTPVKLNTATTAVVKTQTRMKPPRVQPAKIVSLPPVKPVLTREQRIAQEIAQERQALARLRAQLAQARQQGKANVVQQITVQILDREGNIAALQQEMRR